MIVTARGATSCSVCHEPISKGEKVTWTHGVPQVQHLRCTTEGAAATKAIEDSYAATCNMVIPCPPEKSFYPFQKAGIAYANEHKKCLIADEQGLGKTIQVIGLINLNTGIQHVLIVCPSSLKLNWEKELAEWKTRNDYYFIRVVSYNELQSVDPVDWDLVVGDEAHYIKNPESQRSQHFTRIAKNATRILLLTGTPMPSRPAELFAILCLLDPERWTKPDPAKAWKDYAKRYCGGHLVKRWISKKRYRLHYDFSGASNLDELHDIMRSGIMVRRMKADVLKELPEKTRQIVPLGGISQAIPPELERILVFEDWEETIKKLRANKVAFEEATKNRHQDALAKVDFALEYIVVLLESVEKLVIFCWHRDVLNALHIGLESYGVVCIHGDTPNDDSEEGRQRQVERFQKEKGVRIIIGTYGPMGTGWTLTAAQDGVTVELPWTPAELDQAEDRLHRIGQKGHVLWRHLVIDGSFDARIAKLLVKKQRVIERVLG